MADSLWNRPFLQEYFFSVSYLMTTFLPSCTYMPFIEGQSPMSIWVRRCVVRGCHCSKKNPRCPLQDDGDL